MLYLWSLCSNFWWLTLSNAFEKSSKTPSVWLPAMEFRIKSSMRVARSFATKAVLEIIQQIILVHVGDYVCGNNMIKHFA